MKVRNDSSKNNGLYAAEMVPNANGCSNPRSVANIVMTAVGVGVLALPNAVAMGGWIAAPLLLVLAWALTHFQMCLLWKCLFMNPSGRQMHSYEEVGRACFGRPGQIAVIICLYGGIFCICALIMILLGSSLHNISPALSRSIWIVISVLVMLPFAWLPTFKRVGIIAAVGVAATLVVAISVIVAGAREAISSRHHQHALGPQGIGGLGLSFTNLMNSFTCAPVIPGLVTEMRDPSHFPRVAMWAFLTIALCFGSIGFAGYAGWGIDMLNFDLIVDAVASSAGKNDGINYVVQISIIVVSVTHLLVLFAPLGKASDRAVSSVLGKAHWTLMLGGRSVVFLAAMGLALLVPGFGSLFNLGRTKA
ncbi:hypothetical protein FOL47_007668 [Perkinsus chesapeaki]|uniref:Amino acid transporter transmembrane domain-containing protein n=1 Tax=Perkinsus chesapeaki TaxID=330153 RepID=A0A7J6LJ01_PERCH|nr:hypothetical protein FOL47_007668 [Perkinsus chesapeaki]